MIFGFQRQPTFVFLSEKSWVWKLTRSGVYWSASRRLKTVFRCCSTSAFHLRAIPSSREITPSITPLFRCASGNNGVFTKLWFFIKKSKLQKKVTYSCPQAHVADIFRWWNTRRLYRAKVSEWRQCKCKQSLASFLKYTDVNKRTPYKLRKILK